MKIPSAAEYFEQIHKIISQLDDTNIKIIRAMKEDGPRNIQRIGRRVGVKYPTVHARVHRLEESGVLHTWAMPSYSKLGLSRAAVVITPAPGMDLLAREAVRLPGYWLRIIRCMGEYNGYYSVHAIPAENRQDFEHHLDEAVALGLASAYRIFWLGDQDTFLPNFEYYDAARGKWRFDWSGWLEQLSGGQTDGTARSSSEEFQRESTGFDSKDLVILKELEKDGRTTLAEIARMLKVTLPATKYRYDRMKKDGLIRDYVIDVLPQSPEVSDLYEVRLDFRDRGLLLDRAAMLSRLPFVLHRSLIRGTNSVSIRVWLPRGEMNNLIMLLATLVRRNVLTNFGYLWLDWMTIQAQTLPYKFYTDDSGWRYDHSVCLEELHSLASAKRIETTVQQAFQPMSIATRIAS